MRQAHTTEADVDRAMAQLAAQLDSRGASASLLFCSPQYDLEKLGHAIAATFSGPVMACTSAGQLGETGFQKGGITAVSLSSAELRMTPYLISPLSNCQAQASEAAFLAMSRSAARDKQRAFGLVLVDGLSRCEERLAASLYQSLGDVPLIGGSAGDELAFQRTYVYHEGRFLRDAAIFALFETTLSFATFRVQHVTPGRHKLVVTSADPEQRVVQEFNGEPAADAYAEALGLEVEELDAAIFSKNPLTLSSGGEHYVRSVKRLNADHSLRFFCGLEAGLVLSIGESGDALPALQRGFDSVREKIGDPEVVLAFDCVLRRLEFEHDGTDGAVGDLMSQNRVVGFSTYGEQYNAIHVNQTLSAVAISAE